MASTREFDVVIFGATGFTGKLVAEYFQAQYADNESIRWAIAGRNADKLESVKQALSISDSVASIVVDSDDDEALSNLTKRTSVVLTTVGPYQIYGEKLLAACVENATGYTDLCGEPAWMHQMIGKYEARAKETGANIVFSCGFDSIPFDLGVYYFQQHAKAETGKTLKYVKGRVRAMKGTFSGGTAASLKATMAAAYQDKSVLAALKNPYSLANPANTHPQPDGNTPHLDESLNSWSAPFIMAAINTKNVHRSNHLAGYPYGEDFQYDEMLLTGPGEKGQAMAQHVAEDKSLASDDGPKPGEGPSKEERETGFYDVMFVGQTDDGNLLITSVKGDKDPGYGSTSKMISESALCLANDVNLPGGFYTPAAAFGDAIIQRLTKKAGLTFTIER
ncbi:saccharopine dehydrogenase NADP-binding domain-containing protein [Alteromonas sp. KUL49]|uniref:saccharopine dehydrogenase family protein n=1 Tax=Alteromonas sp. KUL49 TaxID=2480798 RepID=UPI00102EF243|nr:saccharopine dehydrogenase NADP-binding domain-containing protein [Alteromonas sp. KUL49]TAP37360.1 saccharopine dehydrogenase [Alteromonas sp. KUL49]GEA12994.1 saccharopine dehydrogenase [Alteromonas sp. KUL49]